MAAKLFFLPHLTATINGIAIPGAKASFYQTGTTTPLAAYQDAGLSVPHSSPVVANGAGRFPAIYLDDTVVYRLILTDADDAELAGGDIDPFLPGVAPDASLLQPYQTACEAAAASASADADAADASSTTAAASKATAVDAAAGAVVAEANAEAAAVLSALASDSAAASAAAAQASSGGGTTANTLTMNTSGAGDASGTAFNGSAPRTISYNTIGAQPSNANLTAYAGANWSAGVQVPALTAANTIALKTIGQASGNILDKAAGDALYAPITGSVSYAPASGSSNYQASSGLLSAYAGQNWSAGVQVPTLTASNTVALKTVGSASGNLLDKGSGDSLYAGLSATNTLTGLNTFSNSVGVKLARNAAQSFTLNGSGEVANTFPVPTLRPSTNNSNIAFDIMPKGAATSISGYGYCWMDICAQDVQEAAGNVQCLHLAIRDTFAEVSQRTFSAAGDDSGTTLPLLFGIGKDGDTTEAFRIRTDSRLQLGAANHVANGSVATSLTSLGPTGSRTTVQKWLRIYDSAGNPFYIPMF